MNIIEFAKFRKMFGSGSGGADSGLGVIESSYMASDCCANGSYDAGCGTWNWVYDCLGYDIYGYALEPDCKTLKLTGAMLDGSFTGGIASPNILFVRGFNSGFDTSPIAYSDISVTPNLFDQWSDDAPTEFTISVPIGLNIDGVYISVNKYSGTPVLECTEVYKTDGKIGTNVTDTFFFMNGFINTPYGEGSNELSMCCTPTQSDCAVYYGNVTSGNKYRVYCTKLNPNNLWESFVFANDDYMTLAVTADDASVGQYVTEVRNGMYDITIPDGCEILNINLQLRGGCTILKLD